MLSFVGIGSYHNNLPGPGNAPEVRRLSADVPKTIDVRWNPPTIPNGNITRYIIYYTPLDDQVNFAYILLAGLYIKCRF